MRDLVNNISVTQILNPILATTTRTSSALDTQGFNSCLLIAHLGFSLDTLNGSVYWTIKIQHSDNGSSFSDAAAEDVHGGVVSYVVNSSSLDEIAYKFGYKGTKRYARLVATNTGTHTNGTPIGMTALRGNPSQAPVA